MKSRRGYGILGLVLLVGFVSLISRSNDLTRQLSAPAAKPVALPPAAKSSAAPAPAFSASLETIQGEWFMIATNPSFAGDIITDYLSYRFLSDGSAIRTSKSGADVETIRGTYTWNAAARQVDVKLNRGSAGIQVWSWKQDSPGLARTVHWKNLTRGFEHPENDTFAKRGSDEWDRRNKRTINSQPSSSFLDPFALRLGATYRLSKVTPLMPEFDPSDPVAALRDVTQLPAGTHITIASKRNKGGYPWYRVQARDAEGWINSVALVGQTLEEAR